MIYHMHDILKHILFYIHPARVQPFTVGFSHGAVPTANQAKDNGFRLEYTQVDYLVKMATMMTTMMTMMKHYFLGR